MEKTWCVYCHTTPSKKRYVGITSKSPCKRWGNGKNYNANVHFSNAIKKYGWENITHEILEQNLSKETACELEKEYIKLFNSYNPEYGYNKTLGGESGAKQTDYVKKLLSYKQKANWENFEYRQNILLKRFGRKHSEETKRKMSIAHKLENLTLEQREKMSKANKGRKYPNRSGHPCTLETRMKISESKKGIHCGGNGRKPRKVICIETQQVFESAKIAEEIVGINKTYIYNCCEKKQKTAKKLHWMFLDEYMAEKPIKKPELPEMAG